MDNEIALTGEKLQTFGFENEREYRLYLKIKKSLQQPIPVGIAS